jgi:hypothetical protein
MPKRSVKEKAKKIEAKKRMPKWILPAIIIAAIIAAVFVIWQSGIFGRYAPSFNDAVKMVGGIDKAHHISFSNYQKGIYYLESHPRYPNPFNFDEMGSVAKEYRSIVGNEAVKLFIDFRSNLVEAEKYYRLSKKSSRGQPGTYGVECKNEPYFLEALNNTEKSIEKVNLMLESLGQLREKYPSEYESLNISDNWVKLMNNTPVDFTAEMQYNKDVFYQFCNKTNSTNSTINSTINLTQ